MEYRTLGQTGERVSIVALADMRRTEWAEANVATCEDSLARIDLEHLYHLRDTEPS
ncbi:MAG: hypothetical protein QGG54_20135 [Gammaproteobacteria bacterium]|nr:hypothetical protein [Gammaproteobacteria bacterium]